MNSKQVICERCHSALATVHVKQRINHQESHRHLCAACAAKEGLASGFVWEGDPFENLLGSFFLPHRSEGMGRCPTCGRSLGDVKRTGRFGCSDCYGVFERRVDLSPFTATEGYKGKRAPRKEAAEENKAAPKAEKPARKAPAKEEQAALLKQQLKQAVEAEEYEQAAKLRDRLRALEQKEEQ